MATSCQSWAQDFIRSTTDTTCKHNYGHYFIYMDWAFGSLVYPEEHEAAMQAAKVKSS